jgi:putative transposase
LSKLRRYYVPNALFFVTQVVDRREPVFSNLHHLELLRQTLRQVRSTYPFSVLAYVFLPDHFHLLFRPHAPIIHSEVMRLLKLRFTYRYKAQLNIRGKMVFWQARYWDHMIRDEDDFQRHMDYIHYNPVKHDYVSKPEDWPHSSYGTWRERDAYPPQWGWTLPESMQVWAIDSLAEGTE